MAVLVSQICQLRRRVFVCKSEAAASCQYCGRSFCSSHGVVLADGQEVCNRRFCAAKRVDLEAHLAYRHAAESRNADGRCGIEGCDASPRGHCVRCVRCKSSYCYRHVEGREETVLVNRVRIHRVANLCRHCWVRRPIWLRT